MTVEHGEVFGFLGPNGAGKTTTIKLLLGLHAPSRGVVRVLGQDPSLPATRARIGFLPEVASYHRFLTPNELLLRYGRLSGLSRTLARERTEQVLELVGLADAADRRLAQFSKGMTQRLGLAQALLHDPELLVLDEPLTGLDPLGRRRIRSIIHELRERGKTVLFSSHELSEAELVCDRVGVLREGTLRWCGPLRQVAGNGEANLERIFLEVLEAGPGEAVPAETTTAIPARTRTREAAPGTTDPGGGTDAEVR
jgi:ABC-2 type transport system ATP-binding protein